jgi:hypothetical protein
MQVMMQSRQRICMQGLSGNIIVYVDALFSPHPGPRSTLAELFR